MSDKIELKAYGKINLGLDVIRKRPDGYHDLDMIMQTVNVYDDIIITKTEKNGEIKVTTDKEVLSNEKGNLAYMAARMLFDEFGINDGIEIRINKRIPIAGGMAGGSADCAATVRWSISTTFRTMNSCSLPTRWPVIWKGPTPSIRPSSKCRA